MDTPLFQLTCLISLKSARIDLIAKFYLPSPRAQGIAKGFKKFGNFIKSVGSTVLGRGQVHMRHIGFEI